MSKEIAEHVTARKVLTGTAVKRVVPNHNLADGVVSVCGEREKENVSGGASAMIAPAW